MQSLNWTCFVKAVGFGVLLLMAGFTYGDGYKRYQLNVEAQNIEQALRTLADVSGKQLLFPYDQVGALELVSISGRYTLKDALKIILKDTSLSGKLTQDGVILITLENKNSARGSEMKMKKSILALTVGSLMGGGVFGQEEMDNSDGIEWLLEEVIVTATKRAQSIQDTAMSISALSGETIDKRNLVGMGDYLNALPGVSVLDQGPGFNSVVIRGISANPQFEGIESSPLSGVYFGETSLSGTGFLGNSADIKLIDMERIEVLRGPQGTLYGDGAMGGVVRNIPKAPDVSQVEGMLHVGYSNTGEEGSGNNIAKGVINIPIIEDTLAIRALAYRFDSSGYYKNTAASDPVTAAAATTFSAVINDRDDVGSNQVVGGRVGALWLPTDELTVNFGYLNQNVEQDGWGQTDFGLEGDYSQRRLSIRESMTPPHYGLPNDNEGVEDNIEIGSLTIEYDLGWATALSSTSKIRENVEIGRDYSAPLGFYPWSQLVGYSTEMFSEEVRLISNLEGKIQFLLGLYYQEKETVVSNVGVFGGTDPVLNVFFGRAYDDILLARNIRFRELNQKAFFGELSYKVSDQLKLSAGGRAFHYDRNMQFQVFDTARSVAGLTVDNSDEDDVSLKASVEYSPIDYGLLYAIWSEGFRLGYPVGANPFPHCDQDGDGFFDGSDAVAISGRSIDSDFAENIEVGSKISLLDQRLSINAAVYQVNWEGIPISVMLDNNCSTSLNAGKARSRGIELELSYSLSDQLLVNFSSSYIDAELTEDAPGLNAEKGDRLPGSPKYNASLGLEYRFSLKGNDGYLRSDYAYVGGFYNNLKENGPEAGNYGNLNLKLGIAIDQIEIDLYADNLTNEDSITWVDAELPNRGNRLRPRTIGFNVAYRF